MILLFNFDVASFSAGGSPSWRPELALVEYSPKTTTDSPEPPVEGILVFIVSEFYLDNNAGWSLQSIHENNKEDKVSVNHTTHLGVGGFNFSATKCFV